MDNREPDVIVDFIFERGLFYIGIENIGDAPACDVSVSFNREIRGVDGSKLISKMPLFQHIEFIPPQKNITTFMDTAASYFRRNQPVDIQTEVHFSNRLGESFKNVIKHNLEIYRDIGYISDKENA
jgi:hypothetical protein